MYRNKGFTLIELLVVIAIISLLLTILLPALNKARQHAKLVACRANLRHIRTGILGYAISHQERLPYAEDINLNDPDVDPFDPAYRTTVGVILQDYVPPRSWKCPAAIAGFPANTGTGGWKMTYRFSTAGPVGAGVYYDDDPYAHTDSPLDPAISNYRHLDGRPLELLDGRRYVQSGGLNHNRKGFWSVRRAIVADMYTESGFGEFLYPHYGVPDIRHDLLNARTQFEVNSHTEVPEPMGMYLELHADGEQMEVCQTRTWLPHAPGF